MSYLKASPTFGKSIGTYIFIVNFASDSLCLLPSLSLVALLIAMPSPQLYSGPGVFSVPFSSIPFQYPHHSKPYTQILISSKSSAKLSPKT